MKQALPTFLFGGDYNPEQWPKETWSKDIAVFKQAQINSASINIFAWDSLQPNEENYDFSQLDEIIANLSQADFKIVLATSTAAMPAWMFKKYPDVARVDYQGRRHVFGQRHNFCPNSPNYRRLTQALVGQLAKRYADNPHIVNWHINNEYGGMCYCQHCRHAFIDWLKNKYQTLENLNQAWNAKFWAHTIHEWDEIVVPNELSEEAGGQTAFSGLSLDYRRFQSASLLECYLLEKAEIEKYDKTTPITTNFHGIPNADLDYFKWADKQDIISYDSYPQYNTPAFETAFWFDLMRGLGKGKPFMLMESTPSQVNWQAYSPLKRPGQMFAQSFQAIAHGADTVQYFQLKQSIGAQEKFHGAVIAHSGRTDTRVFKEITQLGKTLASVGTMIKDSRIEAKVGLVFDWENMWALNYMAGITKDVDYVKTMQQYYQQFYAANVMVDIIGVDDNFEQYTLVVAPNLYMVSEMLQAKLEAYVQAGGNLLTTYLSGLVDEHDNVYLGGYPGALRKLTGIYIEETDVVVPGQVIEVAYQGKNYPTNLVCDLIQLENATALATYANEFYQGTPAITQNVFGKGKVWYVGSQVEASLLAQLVKEIILQLKLPQLVKESSDLEIMQRTKDGKTLTFILNLSSKAQAMPAEFCTKVDLLTQKNVPSMLEAWEVVVI